MAAWPPEPVDGGDAKPRQRLVRDAVGLQQADPGQHAHHVADPERRDEQDQEQPLPTAGEAGHEVRGRIADEQAEQAGDGHVDHRPDHNRPGERRAAHQVAGDVDDVLRAPGERVPHRDGGLEELVELAHRDREHRVERHDEQQHQPDDPRRRQGDPERVLAFHRLSFRFRCSRRARPAATAHRRRRAAAVRPRRGGSTTGAPPWTAATAAGSAP